MEVQTSDRQPVTGVYEVKVDEPDRVPTMKPSEAYDLAWRDALNKASDAWGVKDELVQVKVTVEYGARIDIVNPGGVGVCTVTLSPV